MGIIVSDYDLMQYLNDKNINPANRGYEYMMQAIKQVLITPDYLHKMIVLYQDIGTKCGSTDSRVERAIRHSIETSGVKIKNRDFIAAAVNHFEMGSAKIQKENSHFNMCKR